MICYDLPRSVEVGGEKYEIRTDYRCILDICGVYADPEYSDEEKALTIMDMFYFSPRWEEMPSRLWREAMEKCAWFVDGGDHPTARAPSPNLVDWEQDFRLIAAPVSRVYGQDIRAIPYDPETNTGGLHWWTFLAYYMEIGDCLFAQVMRIRDMKIRGKRMDKQDKEFYRRNQDLIDIKTRYTESEEEFFKQWGGV